MLPQNKECKLFDCCLYMIQSDSITPRLASSHLYAIIFVFPPSHSQLSPHLYSLSCSASSRPVLRSHPPIGNQPLIRCFIYPLRPMAFRSFSVTSPRLALPGLSRPNPICLFSHRTSSPPSHQLILSNPFCVVSSGFASPCILPADPSHLVASLLVQFQLDLFHFQLHVDSSSHLISHWFVSLRAGHCTSYSLLFPRPNWTRSVLVRIIILTSRSAPQHKQEINLFLILITYIYLYFVFLFIYVFNKYRQYFSSISNVCQTIIV